MVKIKIGDKEYNMRFTVGFWERVQSEVDVTQQNIEKRLNEDFGIVSSSIIYYGIMYGMPAELRNKENIPSLEQIKDELDASVMDKIEETMIDGMTVAQKKIVEKAKEIQNKKIDELSEQEVDGKKK